MVFLTSKCLFITLLVVVGVATDGTRLLGGAKSNEADTSRRHQTIVIPGSVRSLNSVNSVNSIRPPTNSGNSANTFRPTNAVNSVSTSSIRPTSNSIRSTPNSIKTTPNSIKTTPNSIRSTSNSIRTPSSRAAVSNPRPTPNTVQKQRLSPNQQRLNSKQQFTSKEQLSANKNHILNPKNAKNKPFVPVKNNKNKFLPQQKLIPINSNPKVTTSNQNSAQKNPTFGNSKKVIPDQNLPVQTNKSPLKVITSNQATISPKSQLSTNPINQKLNQKKEPIREKITLPDQLFNQKRKRVVAQSQNSNRNYNQNYNNKVNPFGKRPYFIDQRGSNLNKYQYYNDKSAVQPTYYQQRPQQQPVYYQQPQPQPQAVFNPFTYKDPRSSYIGPQGMQPGVVYGNDVASFWLTCWSCTRG